MIRRLAPSLPDVLALAGVAMIGAGLWWVYPPAALVIVGTILIGVSLVHASGERGEQ